MSARQLFALDVPRVALELAHRRARLAQPLDAALASPALRIALVNLALAHARRHRSRRGHA